MKERPEFLERLRESSEKYEKILGESMRTFCVPIVTLNIAIIWYIFGEQKDILIFNSIFPLASIILNIVSMLQLLSSMNIMVNLNPVTKFENNDIDGLNKAYKMREILQRNIVKYFVISVFIMVLGMVVIFLDKLNIQTQLCMIYNQVFC